MTIDISGEVKCSSFTNTLNEDEKNLYLYRF